MVRAQEGEHIKSLYSNVEAFLFYINFYIKYFLNKNLLYLQNKFLERIVNTATPFKGKLLNSELRTKPNQNSGLAGPTAQRAAPPTR